MAEYCKHEECRSHARAELGFIDGRINLTARQAGKTTLANALKAINEGEVRCRKVPRKGAVLAPFAPEKS